jgi:hypothetical protein
MIRCSATFVALFLVLALASAPAAEITTTCVFNEATQQLDYSISGGAAGTNYTVSLSDGISTGCVEMSSAPILVGPSDNQSVDVLCTDNQFAGFLRVEFCVEGSLCFESYDLYFYCDESCVVHERDALPSTGPLGLAFLILTLTAAGALLVHRRLATSHN